MMPRGRFSAAMHPVQRIKHVIDSSQVIAKGTAFPIVIVSATDTPTLGVSTSVITGSKVHGIYLKIEVASNDVTDPGIIPNCYLTVYKNPGDNITQPVPNTIGTSDNKRFVIHQEMVMLENTGRGGNARILFNGVIKIPKGYSRFGPNDKLYVVILSPQLDIAQCLQCHYKEFR